LVIELGVLGLLRESELHGYELQRRLSEVLGPVSSVSFGSLYPALNRLEAAGQVKAVESLAAPLQPAMPSTGSFSGEVAAFRASRRRSARGPRNKKVYGLTEDGVARLAELLVATEDEDRTFPLKLAFCRWCDPATRLELLERRRATLAERLAEQRHSLEDQRLDRYVRALRVHDAESTERDIAWLDELITTERMTPEVPLVEAAAPEETAPRSGRTAPVTNTPTSPGARPG
jgi:DNA-binding PadR family transcriptional regulator